MKIFYKFVIAATALSILSVLFIPRVDDAVEGLFQLFVLFVSR